jgi:hypothetical protein
VFNITISVRFRFISQGSGLEAENKRLIGQLAATGPAGAAQAAAAQAASAHHGVSTGAMMGIAG